MSDHITPQEARDMVDAATPGPWKADDETGEINDTNGKQVAYPVSRNGDGDNWIDWATDTDHVLAAAAPEMARMIAGARVQYAVALRTEDGVEYRAPYHTWVKDSQAALWTPNRWSLHPDYWGAGEYIVTRLVIDLGEEEG